MFAMLRWARWSCCTTIAAPLARSGSRAARSANCRTPVPTAGSRSSAWATTAPGGYWYGGWPAWAHGYPLAEQNLMRIMNEVSYLDPHIDDINTVTLDDPELFKYPIAYIIEVGWWTMTDARGRGAARVSAEGRLRHRRRLQVRRRLRRLGGGWEQFAANMQRVLPGRAVLRHGRVASDLSLVLRDRHLDIIPQAYIGGRADFRGVYEDNDPTKRLR